MNQDPYDPTSFILPDLTAEMKAVSSFNVAMLTRVKIMLDAKKSPAWFPDAQILDLFRDCQHSTLGLVSQSKHCLFKISDFDRLIERNWYRTTPSSSSDLTLYVAYLDLIRDVARHSRILAKIIFQVSDHILDFVLERDKSDILDFLETYSSILKFEFTWTRDELVNVIHEEEPKARLNRLINELKKEAHK